MSRYSKDRSTRSISIGPAIAAGQPNENANRTPANNGTVTGAGDEFVYVPGPGQSFQFPVAISWDFTFSGGTFTALAIAIEASNDGVTWTSIDTDNTAVAKLKSIPNAEFKMFRANITTFTVASGSPVVTVSLAF